MYHGWQLQPNSVTVQKIIDNIRTQYELINHLKDGLEDQLEVIGEMLENLEVKVVNNKSLEK